MYFPYFDFFLFDKDAYWFNRETKDLFPYRLIEKDGKFIVVLNALGIAKEDITVDVKGTSDPREQLLVINGNTHNEVLDKDYNVNIAFKVYRTINSIEWDAKDGIVQLTLSFAEPVKPNVNIIRK